MSRWAQVRVLAWLRLAAFAEWRAGVISRRAEKDDGCGKLSGKFSGKSSGPDGAGARGS